MMRTIGEVTKGCCALGRPGAGHSLQRYTMASMFHMTLMFQFKVLHPTNAGLLAVHTGFKAGWEKAGLCSRRQKGIRIRIVVTDKIWNPGPHASWALAAFRAR